MAEAVPQPLDAEIILFVEKDFHGPHKHIFNEVKDLRFAVGETTPNTTFADKTSSIVVVMGTWQVSEDANHLGHKQVLTPGRYPDVVKAGIHNERVSSLLPKKAPTSSPSPPPS
jgi:hypothetical protein